MAEPSSNKSTFSASQRWGIGFNLIVRVVVALALVVMANYLSAHYFKRLSLSSKSKIALSSRTLSVLRSVTNNVKVTVYYDKDDDIFPMVLQMLQEYQNGNSHISLKVVDYNRDAGDAANVLREYTRIGTNKNLVIFDRGEGRYLIGSGSSLMQYDSVQVPNPKELEFIKKPVLYYGERVFTSLLLGVTSEKPLRAYFLQGHGENDPRSAESTGYRQFAMQLAADYIEVSPLLLRGSNTITASNCDVLVIAGPKTTLEPQEIAKIRDYLGQGGRLLALFSFESMNTVTGLEALLRDWGVGVRSAVVLDRQNAPPDGVGFFVRYISQHPIVKGLKDEERDFYLYAPRLIYKLKSENADAPRVDELAFSSPTASLSDTNITTLQNWPVAVAVEKNGVAGLPSEGGLARIVVIGDTYFLDNAFLDRASNRDFAGYVMNWLTERTHLLENIGPRPVTQFRLIMSARDLQVAQWLLLAALPGAILFLGCVVWARRRK